MTTERPNDQDRERVTREDWAQHEPDAPETEPDSQDEPDREPGEDDNPAR